VNRNKKTAWEHTDLY